MNNREKLENLKCVLDDLTITYKTDISINKRLADKFKEKNDIEFIKSKLEAKISEEKLELLEYIRGFI